MDILSTSRINPNVKWAKPISEIWAIQIHCYINCSFFKIFFYKHHRCDGNNNKPNNSIFNSELNNKKEKKQKIVSNFLLD